ncbi:oxidoreductase [Streptomyces yokosukanensis]|uniref:Oxidoreductase n=1 Tax=Streptomyces yokosukanensis TaxID=67386 RepID=A0A101P1L6_9ACTN|nr:oxidoreductase [Streptomyces yokosukanensis]KUN03257.1 oxidoreductase [Streptomyces yokosukanensis]
MSGAYATFDLAPAIRAGGVLADGGYQVHRDFVDFVVDGRPLLFQLSDLDAVSPLASDVPPAIFTEQVRALLLEAEPPLPDGRFVIYGCPECADLGCGAVTAVIERDGEDYIWRDFAWQTDEHADLELNGYQGVGPFRFHGAEYRAALTSLSEGPPRRRVLLIGARVAVLAKLAAALRTIGIGADITQDARAVPAEELRGYGAVAFGRAVTETERAVVLDTFEHAGVEVARVDGLAPIVPLLVAQIEHALDRSPLPQRRLTGLAAASGASRGAFRAKSGEGAADVEVTSACRVRITAYRLDRLYRTHTREVYDGVLEPGRHRVPLDPRAVRGQAYVVARTTAEVLAAPVTGAPGG